MADPTLSIRTGHPDFLDLDWATPLVEWTTPRLIELPTGIHRHVVRFVAYEDSIYAIKELPTRFAHHEYQILRSLETRVTPVAEPVGLVDRGWVDPTEEWSAALITAYVPHTFPYRNLVSGTDFGARRDHMLNAVAVLLVELHLTGLFWGDCSLSNLLYRYDAETIEAVMIDAETSELHDELTRGQRAHDIEIMVVNVAGGMADIAAAAGHDIDEADMSLGVDIASRYGALWAELTHPIYLRQDERYRVHERVRRINELGFEVEDIDIEPDPSGDARLRLRATVGGRRFHRSRLRTLTGVDATERQARQILQDLSYYEASHRHESNVGKSIAAVMWRVNVFEPLLERIRTTMSDGADAVQLYCDFLHHRYLISVEQQRDVPTAEAFEQWLEGGMPGVKPEEAIARLGL